MIPGKLLAIKTQINRHLIQFALTCAVVPEIIIINKTIMQKCCVQLNEKHKEKFIFPSLYYACMFQ